MDTHTPNFYLVATECVSICVYTVCVYVDVHVCVCPSLVIPEDVLEEECVQRGEELEQLLLSEQRSSIVPADLSSALRSTHTYTH